MRFDRAILDLCLIALLATACNDGNGPGTGTVEVTTVSTGDGLDPDGYVVRLDGADPTAIGINATATLAEVPAGDLEIRLAGVRGNCAIQGVHPRTIRVVAGETFRLHFDVACPRTPLMDRIVFTSDRDGNIELYSMKTDGTDVVRLTNTPDDDDVHAELQPAVSPDGTKILFTLREGPELDFYDSDVYVMNADGTGRMNLTNTPGRDEEPAWSPDGSRIAFQSRRDGSYDIWVMNADGSGQVNLTDMPTNYGQTPVWSPDGDRILFTTANPAGTASELDIMSPDGSGRRRFSDDGGDASNGVWSPDGSLVAFTTGRTGRTRIFTLDADGSDPVQVTGDSDSYDDNVSWAPAGDRLAFSNDATGDEDVYVINADGSGLVNLTNNPAFDFVGPQAWGP